MLSERLIVGCHRCDNGILSNLECIEPHVRVPPPAPTGRCILFTLANRLPRLTNLTMHDSANTQRRSIDRLLQGGFWVIASQTGLLRKPNPTPEHLNGMGFPVEASSGNCSPESALRLGCNFPMGPSGKLRPGICSRNGTRFPRGPKQPPAPRQNDPFPPSYTERPRSVPGCRHNRNVPSCWQHFAATDTMAQSEGTKKIGAPARDRGSGLRQ